MIKALFLDLDDTLLDFHGDQRVALSDILRSLGVTPTEEIIKTYTKINLSLWQALERGELEREEVLVRRFSLLAEAFGLELDAVEARNRYESRLSEGHTLLPGALDTLDALFGKYPLYIVSNGTGIVQNRRLDESGLRKYFAGIYISEEVGANKPDARFFNTVLGETGVLPTEALVVGDSLTSDIKGGINSGIPTCHLSPSPVEYTAIKPDYVIRSISELPELIEKINGSDSEMI